MFTEDKAKEAKALRFEEKETFKKLVVVDNLHFQVNKRDLKTHIRDKYIDIREGPVKKYGYKLPAAVIKKMNHR